MRRRGPLRNKGELEVADDTIDHGEIRDEGDDLHPAPALGTDHNNRIRRMDYLPFAEQFSEKPFHAHRMRRNFPNV